MRDDRTEQVEVIERVVIVWESKCRRVNRTVIVRIDRLVSIFILSPLTLTCTQDKGRLNTTNNMRSTTSLLFLLTLVKAHGDHSFDLSDEDIGMSYAERHVRYPRSLFFSHVHPTLHSLFRP
jgi:hypothetical protein